MKKIAVFVMISLLLSVLLSACGGATGTYSYDNYSLEIKEADTFVFRLGSTMLTGRYEKDDNGVYHFTNESQFTSVNATGTIENGTLFLSGNVILRNANRSVSDRSLLDMENVPFKK